MKNENGGTMAAAVRYARNCFRQAAI